MNSIHKVLGLSLTLAVTAVLAVPAAVDSMKAAPKQPSCFASGASTYQIVANAPAPDYRIRIDSQPTHADLRMQLVDRAEHADFVLVDDFSDGEPRTCKSSTPIRTVTLDGDASKPDVTVHLYPRSENAALRRQSASAGPPRLRHGGRPMRKPGALRRPRSRRV